MTDRQEISRPGGVVFPDRNDTASVLRRPARGPDPWADTAAHAGSAARAAATPG